MPQKETAMNSTTCVPNSAMRLLFITAIKLSLLMFAWIWIITPGESAHADTWSGAGQNSASQIRDWNWAGPIFNWIPGPVPSPTAIDFFGTAWRRNNQHQSARTGRRACLRRFRVSQPRSRNARRIAEDERGSEQYQYRRRSARHLRRRLFYRWATDFGRCELHNIEFHAGASSRHGRRFVTHDFRPTRFPGRPYTQLHGTRQQFVAVDRFEQHLGQRRQRDYQQSGADDRHRHVCLAPG